MATEKLQIDITAEAGDLIAAVKSAVKVLNDLNSAAGKAGKSLERANGPMKGLKITSDDLHLSILTVDKSMTKAVRSIDSVTQASKKLETISPTALRETEKQVSSIEPKAQTLTAQLRAMKNELSALESAGKATTPRFRELSVQAARLQDQVGDTSTRIRALASDTANLDAGVKAFQALGGAVAITSGLIGVFGVENKKAQEISQKLNGIIAASVGLQQVALALNKDSILVLKLQALAMRANAAATVLTATLYRSLGVAVNTATFSFKAFRAALITTGVGALVVGVGILVSKIIESNNATKDFKESLDSLNKEYAVGASRLLVLTTAAANNALSLKQRLSAVTALRTEFGPYFKDLTNEAILNGNVASAVKLATTAILNKAKASAAEKDLTGKVELQRKQQKDLATVTDQLVAAKERQLFLETQIRDASDSQTKSGLLKSLQVTKTAVQDLTRRQLDLFDSNFNLKREANELALEIGGLTDAFTDANDPANGLKTTIDKVGKSAKEIERPFKILGTQIGELVLSTSPAVAGVRLIQEAVNNFSNEKVEAAKRSLQQLAQIVNAGAPVPTDVTAGRTPATAVLDAIKARGAISAELMENIAIATANTQAAFALLGPVIDQTFNAIANGENAFDSIIQGLKRLVVELIKAVVQAAILSAVLSALPGGAGTASFATVLKGLFGFRANGGFVGGGKPYMVGEAGPELFVPQSSGNIVPNVGGGGAGGVLSAVVRGNDLVFILNNASRNRNTNFG